MLAYLGRGRHPAFGWTLASAICLAVALGVWILFVALAHAQISQWTLDSIPRDWTQWRAQWEYAHAARTVLLMIGFGFLVQLVLAETRQVGSA